MKLILPFPPSVNTYWRHPNKGALAGKSLISAAGRKFQSAACAAIIEQLRRLPKPTSAPASVEIVLFPPDIRYKHSVETIDSEHADLIFRMRPVWYRSQCENDRRDWGFYGLIAEEVGEIAPQFVHWRSANEDDAPEAISSNGLVAEGVMYERLVVPLIHHIQKLTERVDELESELKLLSTSRSDIG